MNPDEFWSLVDQSAGPEACWPWRGPTNGSNRGRVAYAGRLQYAYRIAYELANGEPVPDDLVARHRCDNPICVNPAHIEPGTVWDNARDMVERGRARGKITMGIDHHLATVPPDVIARAIGEYRDGNETQKAIAERYGVGQSTFSRWLLGDLRPDAGITPGSKPRRPCGTRAAYERHRRNGERPCEACRAAELVDQARRREAKRNRAA